MEELREKEKRIIYILIITVPLFIAFEGLWYYIRARDRPSNERQEKSLDY